MDAICDARERHRAGVQGHPPPRSARSIETVGRQKEADVWTSDDLERPRRGWIEWILWVVLLLTLVAVPVTCTAEFAGPMLRS